MDKDRVIDYRVFVWLLGWMFTIGMIVQIAIRSEQTSQITGVGVVAVLVWPIFLGAIIYSYMFPK